MADRDRDTSTLLGADIESHHLVDVSERAELERQAGAIDGFVGIELDFVSLHDESKITRIFYRFGPGVQSFDIHLANLAKQLPGYLRMARWLAEGETESDVQRHLDMQQRKGDYAHIAMPPNAAPSRLAPGSAAVNKIKDDEA